MGAIISRFRKAKTTSEILEGLEQKIKDSEAYTISTQERRRRIVGRFLIGSIALYIVCFCVFYFIFLPTTWNDRLLYSIPLLISPMVIVLIKKFLTWIFERKVEQKASELKELQAEKKRILEKVMETETYKIAVEILNKYGDKAQRALTQSQLNVSITNRSPKTPVSARSMTALPHSANRMQVLHPPGPMSPAMIARQSPGTPGYRVSPMPMPIGVRPGMSQPRSFSANPTMPYRRTPFPIIDQSERSAFERMIDYMVGDGPNNRFAMICAQCSRHNGMALRDEYEYAAYRCAFCSALNPARKQRPAAPRLPSDLPQLDRVRDNTDASESGSEAGDPPTESDETRSPGVGEEGRVDSEVEQADREVLPTEASATPEPAAAEDSGEQPTTEKMEIDDDETTVAATLPEVPLRPETVGSKKDD